MSHTYIKYSKNYAKITRIYPLLSSSKKNNFSLLNFVIIRIFAIFHRKPFSRFYQYNNYNSYVIITLTTNFLKN